MGICKAPTLPLWPQLKALCDPTCLLIHIHHSLSVCAHIMQTLHDTDAGDRGELEVNFESLIMCGVGS